MNQTVKFFIGFMYVILIGYFVYLAYPLIEMITNETVGLIKIAVIIGTIAIISVLLIVFPAMFLLEQETQEQTE